MNGMTRPARGLAVFAIALGTVLFSAAPASAHGVAGVQPTNYEVRITSVVPRLRGVELRAVDLGNRLELRNNSDRDIVVLGYRGEPYLRVGPNGAEENMRSPATYLNKRNDLTEQVPSFANASAAPHWRRLTSSPVARWHDHRAHWMGTQLPPSVKRDPGKRQVVQHFVIMLRDGSVPIRVTGDVVWVPGPSPWPAILGALLLAFGVFALSRTRVWAWVLGGTLAVLVATESLHVLGLWGATTVTGVTKLAASAYSLGGIVVGIVALVWLVRRGGVAATPAVLVAAVFLIVSGGLGDITVLSHSQVPSTLPDWIARLEVVVALGLGVGLLAASALRLRAPTPAPSGGREPHGADVTS
jgi:hypothetical protein